MANSSILSQAGRAYPAFVNFARFETDNNLSMSTLVLGAIIPLANTSTDLLGGPRTTSLEVANIWAKEFLPLCLEQDADLPNQTSDTERALWLRLTFMFKLNNHVLQYPVVFNKNCDTARSQFLRLQYNEPISSMDCAVRVDGFDAVFSDLPFYAAFGADLYLYSDLS